MTQYACVQCCQVAQPGDYDCSRCGGALAGVLEHEPMTRFQYTAICHHFLKRGVVNRAERMRFLSRLTGRTIRDYWDVTTTEATAAEAALREWAYGSRT